MEKAPLLRFGFDRNVGKFGYCHRFKQKTKIGQTKKKDRSPPEAICFKFKKSGRKS